MDNTTTQTKKQNDDQNNSADVPTMTEDEMKKFISTLANTQEIQGDYVFNGFLFFFQTINEAIRSSQVEAQNLMLHLQEHVFHKLMWESFWAFDAHRKKAHLIFEKTEPFVEYEPIVDLSETELEDLALPLSTLLKNPHLPESIKDALEGELNGNHTDFYTPENIAGNLRELQKQEAR